MDALSTEDLKEPPFIRLLYLVIGSWILHKQFRRTR